VRQKAESSPLEGEPPVAADNVANVALHRLEAHSAASLTFEMVDDGSQGLEVVGAAAVGTVVQRLLICPGCHECQLCTYSYECPWSDKWGSTYERES